MKNIKCVICDVDGTLVDPLTNKVLNSSLQAIQQLQAKGIKVAIATGRSHYALTHQLDALNLDFVISCSGAILYDIKAAKMIDEHLFDVKDTQTMVDLAKKYNTPLMFKYDDAMYFYQNIENIPWLAGNLKDGTLNLDMFKYDTTRHLTGQTQPGAAMLYCDSETVEIFKRHTNLLYIAEGHGGYDITPLGINKASGLPKLCQYLNIQKDEIIYFGDHLNDESMFDALPYGIAMGNAIDTIKQKAYYITDACNHDGIYNALKHFEII